MIIPLTSGDEQDALTGWRRYMKYRPGERKAVKRRYNRRVRRDGRRQIRQEA